MIKSNDNDRNKGFTLTGVIFVIVILTLIVGGVYYFLSAKNQPASNTGEEKVSRERVSGETATPTAMPASTSTITPTPGSLRESCSDKPKPAFGCPGDYEMTCLGGEWQCTKQNPQ